MSADWQPGDLAIVARHDPDCSVCKDNPVDPSSPKDGTTLHVVTVLCIASIGGCGLRFSSLDGFWCSCGFRKIRPDEQQGERQDWIDLLKVHSRPKVDA